MITAKASMANTSKRIDVMTQTLCVEDGSLLQGLMVQNAYTKLRKESKNVIIVVRKNMAYPQNPKEENPSGKSSWSYLGARAPDTKLAEQG